MPSERNLAIDAVPHSAHPENPALAMRNCALVGCERRLKKAIERNALLHLREPPANAVRVLLIDRAVAPRVSFAKQARVNLGHHRTAGGNLPAIEGPEVERAAEFFPQPPQPRQARVR